MFSNSIFSMFSNIRSQIVYTKGRTLANIRLDPSQMIVTSDFEHADAFRKLYHSQVDVDRQYYSHQNQLKEVA